MTGLVTAQQITVSTSLWRDMDPFKNSSGVNGTPTNRDAEDVCLQLHQQLVGCHSSVYLELCQRDAAVLIHGVQYLHTSSYPCCCFFKAKTNISLAEH